MKTACLFILVSNLALNSFSQEIITEQDLPKTKKLQFGFSFSPDVCYRALNTTENDETMQSIIKSRNGHEIIKLGYSAGANVYYHYKRHLDFEAGLRYSNCGYGTAPIDISYISVDPNVPNFFRFVDGFNYVEAPVKIILKRGDKKLDFFLHASIIPALLIQGTSREIKTFPDGHDEKELDKSSTEFKKFNLFSSAGIGMVYHFTNESQIRIEPTFKFGLLSIVDAPIDGYLWNTGLNISYYF